LDIDDLEVLGLVAEDLGGDPFAESPVRTVSPPTPESNIPIGPELRVMTTR